MRSALAGTESASVASFERETVKEAIQAAREWLAGNPEAAADEIEEKHAEVEEACYPLIQRFYPCFSGEEKLFPAAFRLAEAGPIPRRAEQARDEF